MSGDGMSGFVSALTASSGGLTSANLYAELTTLAPFIASMVIFAFGVWALRKLIKKAQRGKADI